MAALLVTYDLNRSGQNYTAVLDFIKQHAWAQLSESSYAIATNASASQVRDHVRAVVDQNDNVYVIPLGRMWAGFGPQEVNDWLNQHL